MSTIVSSGDEMTTTKLHNNNNNNNIFVIMYLSEQIVLQMICRPCCMSNLELHNGWTTFYWKRKFRGKSGHFMYCVWLLHITSSDDLLIFIQTLKKFREPSHKVLNPFPAYHIHLYLRSCINLDIGLQSSFKCTINYINRGLNCYL